MKTTFGSGGHKDEDLKMARQLETGEPGGGLRGETDKGMLFCIHFPFVELLVAKSFAYKTIHEKENMSEADNSVQKI